VGHIRDAEDLVLALGRAANIAAALRTLGDAVDVHPALVDDHRVRVVVDGLIDTVMTECWSTDEIRAAMGERAARLLDW
jgi:hypothetical protein